MGRKRKYPDYLDAGRTTDIDPLTCDRTGTATQRLKPRELWTYNVDFFDRRELITMSEFRAPHHDTVLSPDELTWFLKSPDIVVNMIQVNTGSLFF